MLVQKIKDFIELTRAYALGVTFASCFVIFSYSYYCENFSFFNFLLLVIALSCVHLGANLFDDYIDVKQKVNQGIKLEDIFFNTFIQKARLIINRKFSFTQIKLILFVLFSIAILIGLYFAFYSGFLVLLYAFVGAIAVLFYPVSSKYYLSEIIIGLIYGPLMITGGYYALCGCFNLNLFILSLAIFFATLVLLHTHNIMDWEFDIKEGKNTLAILSKDKNNAVFILQGLIFLAYFIVVSGVFTFRFNPKILYCFLTLPIAVKLIESIKDYINIKDVKFEPRWYWGMFENWQMIKDNKLDFFMFRFYLARNFSFFFALFIAIGAMIK